MKEYLIYINALAGRTITITGLNETTMTQDNVLAIINETTAKVLYSPLKRSNISSVSYSSGTLTINLASKVTALVDNDKLLVKLYTDAEVVVPTDYAKESTLTDATNGLSAIKAAITALYGGDLTATLSALKTAIGNIDIDTTDLAKAAKLQDAQDDIDALQVLVGSTTDASTDSTIFGKFAAVISAISALSIPTVQDIQNGLAKSSELPTDYAKDSSVKDGNDTAISVTKDVQGKVGTKDSSDAEEPSTLFAWFRRLFQNIQSVLSSVYDAQNTKSAVSEAASANTKIGTNADQAVEISGSGTIFGRLKAIIDNYLDNQDYGLSKIYTDTAKESSVKTNVGGTDYTAIGELRDNNHGLSALLAKLAQIIADIGTIQTETEILSLPNAARIDIVTPEQSSGAISNLQIHANVMYHLGDLTALSLIMVEPSDLTIYNEFVVCFFCQTGFTLQITHWDANTQVLFNSGATCEAGHYYILSVVDNLALLAKF